MSSLLRGFSLVLCVTVVSAGAAFAQGFSTSIAAPYRVVPNITYLTANNFDAKLDVYPGRTSPRRFRR